MQEITSELGGSAFEWATKPEDRSRLWKARHNAYYAAKAMAPGKHVFATDACVPISRLADCVLETKADADATGLVAPIVGHVGDGNFHLCVLFDPDEKTGERQRAEDLARRISLRAIEMGGTCTGEHGVGVHKLDALVAEHGDAVELMRTIKRALDPCNIMNPGKTVPL
jgi:D-lactate dehydrogenase (cytochrome)